MITLKDLLSPEELEQYQETVYPFNLSILHNALKLKLEEDPDYEVWVPLVYYKFLPYLRAAGKSADFNPYKVFISNKGRVQSFRYKEPRILAVTQPEDGYEWINLQVGKTSESVIIHRAMGCNFIPLPEELKLSHPKDLQVNHIDGIKSNKDLGNLEWVTPSRNQLHASENGLMPSGVDSQLTKAVKGVVLKGLYTGHAFILHGLKDHLTYGFQQPNISACCAGRVKSHKSCKWTIATPEEIESLPAGISDSIKQSLI